MKITTITDLDADSLIHSVELDTTTDEIDQYVKPVHYIDNKQLQAAFLVYHEKKLKWKAEGKEGTPPLCNTIGSAILEISKRRLYSRNFISYTQSWKDRMMGNAIETCVKYAHNYDPTKYNNPFAYITQIVSSAFIQGIKDEKKQLYIKYKAFDNVGGFSAFSDEELTDDAVALGFKETSDLYSGYLQFIADYERSMIKSKDEVEHELSLSDFINEIEE